MQDGVAQRQIFVAPEDYANLQYRVGWKILCDDVMMTHICCCVFQLRGQLIGSDLSPVSDSVTWKSATQQNLVCDNAQLFQLTSIVKQTVEQLQTAPDNETSTLLAKLDVLNFQGEERRKREEDTKFIFFPVDAWIACIDQTTSLMSEADVTIVLQNSTLCTPELTASGDPCCSLQGKCNIMRDES